MNYANVLRYSALTVTICTLVPFGVIAAWKAAPAVSDRIISSAVREMGAADKQGSYTTEVPPRVNGIDPTGRTALDIEAAPTETEEHSSPGTEIPAAKPSQEVLDAIPYPTGLDYGDGSIEKTTYGAYSGEQYFDLDGGGQVRNCTWYTNDELYRQSQMGRDFEIETGSPEPQVLIYHTHTTESFELEERSTYDSAFDGKTTEPDKNITAVGDEICRMLEEYGITVIHDTLVHDIPSYNGAYDSSRETVSELLAEYPSIKVALDIHRDGIETAEGVRIAPVAEIEGREAAQIMIISGCDDGTMGMPEHLKNFHFACELQSCTESLFPGLTRPILFDYRHYNQDMTTGSLLIEVGSHGNTLDSAKYSGELIGSALGELLTKIS